LCLYIAEILSIIKTTLPTNPKISKDVLTFHCGLSMLILGSARVELSFGVTCKVVVGKVVVVGNTVDVGEIVVVGKIVVVTSCVVILFIISLIYCSLDFVNSIPLV